MIWGWSEISQSAQKFTANTKKEKEKKTRAFRRMRRRSRTKVSPRCATPPVLTIVSRMHTFAHPPLPQTHIVRSIKSEIRTEHAIVPINFCSLPFRSYGH